MEINPTDFDISHNIEELEATLSPKLYDALTQLIDEYPDYQVFIENYFTDEAGEHLSVYFMGFPPIIYDLLITPNEEVIII